MTVLIELKEKLKEFYGSCSASDCEISARSCCISWY